MALSASAHFCTDESPSMVHNSLRQNGGVIFLTAILSNSPSGWSNCKVGAINGTDTVWEPEMAESIHDQKSKAWQCLYAYSISTNKTLTTAYTARNLKLNHEQTITNLKAQKWVCVCGGTLRFLLNGGDPTFPVHKSWITGGQVNLMLWARYFSKPFNYDTPMPQETAQWYHRILWTFSRWGEGKEAQNHYEKGNIYWWKSLISHIAH